MFPTKKGNAHQIGATLNQPNIHNMAVMIPQIPQKAEYNTDPTLVGFYFF